MPLLWAKSSATSSASVFMSPLNPPDTFSIAASTSLFVNCEGFPVSPSPLRIFSRSSIGSSDRLTSSSGFASGFASSGSIPSVFLKGITLPFSPGLPGISFFIFV